MGLTAQSTGVYAARAGVRPEELSPHAKVIALAGNPNVGKSTLFNRLTGMKQHTGNWPGKTVTNAVGRYRDARNDYWFVDIPGTYSLMANSAEEEVARDFLCFGNPDAAVVVCDATCLERNLNLVLQTIEIRSNVIVCVNLLDEARKKGIVIDLKALSRRLGVPVVGASARSGVGVEELVCELERYFAGARTAEPPIRITYIRAIEAAIAAVEPLAAACLTESTVSARWVAIKLLEGDGTLLRSMEEHLPVSLSDNAELSAALAGAREHLEAAGITKERFKDYIVSGLVLTAESICDEQTVRFTNPAYHERDHKIDRVLTGKITGPLVMIALLAVIFWITVSGANYPSEVLWQGFSYIEGRLIVLADAVRLPALLSDMLIKGVYRVLAWVVSVMLPPMAIFFPLFTLLEDLGYLPRVAFNLDKGFRKCSACGKQALSMCMGFGCNAAGITGCRIIDSPRERLIAILTNNFVPCNGRFPTLIAIISMFFVAGVGAGFQTVAAAGILTLFILLGIAVTFGISGLLSKTLLKGQPSSFTLELPPYRRPRIGSVIIRSIFDRTVFVLGRAVSVAAPAGLIIWLMANVRLDGQTLLAICSGFLDPFARLMGLDGVILLGFILGFPANEIVIPIIIMAYMANGTLSDYASLAELKTLLVDHGWTWTTAVCTMLFSLMHWPCSTALITVKKETGSWYWTMIAFLVPTVTGILACMLFRLITCLF